MSLELALVLALVVDAVLCPHGKRKKSAFH
jgi:hypothetical protein